MTNPSETTVPSDYKERFVKRFTDQDVDHEVAAQEHDAWVESIAADELQEPELDADEAMSYWTE